MEKVLVSSVPNFVLWFPLRQRPMADRDAASAAHRGRIRRLRGHRRREQLSVRMAVAAAVRHSRDRTCTAVDAAVQVGGCVEQNVDAPVSQSVEQIVDVPVREFQEGMAEHIVDVTVRAIKGTEPPKKCRRRKQQKEKLGRDCDEELLAAAMARARDEEDEFLLGGAAR